jgi:hypothetical protein
MIARWPRLWVVRAGMGIVAAFFLIGARIIFNAPVSFWGILLPILFTLAILGVGSLEKAFLGAMTVPGLQVNVTGLALTASGLIFLAVSIITQQSILCLLAIALVYGLALAYSKWILSSRNLFVRWGIGILSAALMGLWPIALVEVLNRFSDEEFFVALQGVILAIYWFLLWLAMQGWQIPTDRPKVSRRVRLSRFLVLGIGAVILIFGAVFTLRSYQSSFFPSSAPTYPGITDSNPFLCGEVAHPATNTAPIDGKSVYREYLDGLITSSGKSVMTDAELFIGTGDTRWAQAFHQDLLQEVKEQLFTQPANSVKSIQYDAALRVYYYTRVIQLAPNLFTPQEQAEIRTWFTAINQRALTVEWVDWMYALAFSKLPQGPYENQENGSGLLALLEYGGYSNPQLSQDNLAYLAENPRGWQARFRNTDDAISYQPEWLNNAFFQKLFSGKALPQYISQSYEWLLLQTLPDGRAPKYNPSQPLLIGTFLQAATQANDGRYLWIADQAIKNIPDQPNKYTAQPGIGPSAEMKAIPPKVGSCLIYGGSGLPNQIGQLAPDKIVFRDGWNVGDTYLLLNLRFTGWHRYKATNSIVLLDKDGPLVAEASTGKDFSWLPKGRALFRDKRIPRENLNGFLVQRRGMDEALFLLTGSGGMWAQNPPFFASVESFLTGTGMDYSRSTLKEWNGWNETRSIFFTHGGPIVILDQAQGPVGQDAGIAWHFQGSSTDTPGRFLLDNGKQKMELVLIPQGEGNIELLPDDGVNTQSVLYQAAGNGQAQLVSVFLNGAWMGAHVSMESSEEGPFLKISNGGKSCTIRLNEPNKQELSQFCDE